MSLWGNLLEKQWEASVLCGCRYIITKLVCCVMTPVEEFLCENLFLLVQQFLDVENQYFDVKVQTLKNLMLEVLISNKPADYMLRNFNQLSAYVTTLAEENKSMCETCLQV